MEKSGVVEGIDRLIQAVEASAISREELQSVLHQLHEANEELQRYLMLNAKAKDLICMQEEQLKKLSELLVSSNKKAGFK